MTGLRWLKLLRAHERRNGQGLTILYLVGAMREPIGSSKPGRQANIGDLVELCRSLRDDAPEGVWTRVAECSDIKQPVVYLKSSFYAPSEIDCRLVSPNHDRLTMVAQANYVSDPKRGIDALVDYLWQRLGEPMLAGKLSLRRSTLAFDYFNDNEVAFVKDAFREGDDTEDIQRVQDSRWKW